MSAVEQFQRALNLDASLQQIHTATNDLHDALKLLSAHERRLLRQSVCREIERLDAVAVACIEGGWE